MSAFNFLSYVQCACIEYILSYDVPSGSDRMPCIKIDIPLVVYKFSGSVIK